MSLLELSGFLIEAPTDERIGVGLQAAPKESRLTPRCFVCELHGAMHAVMVRRSKLERYEAPIALERLLQPGGSVRADARWWRPAIDRRLFRQVNDCA